MNITPKTPSPHESKAPATAAGQYLGYSLQQTLLAIRLRQAAAGSACSLEVLDDVAEQAADGTIHLTQSKSALTDNPVANRAVSLWKTLYNWLELVKLKLVDPDTTTFEIYVSRQVGGDLVELFHKASNDTTASQALKTARDLLWGAASNHPLKPTISKALQKYANPVLEADELLVIPIIRHFCLTCSESGDPIGDFEKLIAGDPLPIKYVPFIVCNLLGRVIRMVRSSIPHKEGTIIPNNVLSAFENNANKVFLVRRIIEHVAGMTDRYLSKEFNRLHLSGREFEQQDGTYFFY